MTGLPQKRSLLVIFLTVFIDLLGFGIVLPLLPVYAEQFTTDPTGIQLGLLMASFSAMQFLFAPLWGRLSDRIGRRPVIMIGLSGSVIFYVLFGVASIVRSFSLLMVSRVGAGLAGATISTAQAYIADSTSLENRPKGMALIGMAFGLGFTLGPLVGYLAVAMGSGGDPGPWPGYLAAGLSAIALALAWRMLPESLRPGSASAAKRWLNVAALGDAISVPSIMALLVSIFICVWSFANFETTLALLIKGMAGENDPFRFTFGQVFLTFAYIGLVLALVQGFFMRRLAGRLSEGLLATSGAGLQIAGYFVLVASIWAASALLLLFSLAVIVAGFAIMSPSLNSLVSRRSDPARQGGILGLGQSVNSLARIVGSAVGIPLLKIHIALPFHCGAALMAGGLLLVLWASGRGADYPAAEERA